MRSNKARQLLWEIERRRTSRAQDRMMVPLVGAWAAMALAATGDARAILLAVAITCASMAWAMARVGREVASAVGEVAVLYAIHARVVEFRVPDWHIVGTE